MLRKYYLPSLILAALTLLFCCKSGKSNEKRQTAEDWSTPPHVIEGLSKGNKAPELSGPNPNDSVIALSSMRGYYVLVDFWASWCSPCRWENPNVVKTYNEYKDKRFKHGAKGFRVFNVSLDNGKNPWIAAIKKDNLSWPYHISDLKGWNSEYASKYQVMSIPTNWLIDPRGVIVAQGLRGPALEATLKTYLDTTTIAEPVKNQKKNR